MEQINMTQENLDRIIKKNSAKYLKKLEEKEAEVNMYKEALDDIAKVIGDENASFTPPVQSEQPLNDDEIINKVEQVLQTPQNRRTKEEADMLEAMKDDYAHALFKKDMAEAKKWADENYDGDFNDILENEEFLDFTLGISGKLPDLVKKYVKFTSKQNDAKNVKTPGSVKDTSGVVAKEYFSKEEVEKMSPEQIKKHMPVIEKSMSKW